MSVDEGSGTLISSETKIRWRIENFTSKMESSTGTVFNSPYFKVHIPGKGNIKFRLQLYPSGENEKSIEYLSLYLNYDSEATIKIEFSLSVWNESTKTVYEKDFMSVSEFRVDCDAWGYLRFLKKEKLQDKNQNYLDDDTLTILCKISMPENLSHDDSDTISVYNHNEELLDNEKFSDVVAIFGSEKILLHKIMLTSISPVFQAMFNHNMKENSENEIRITDIKYNIAMEMFRYIYCRKVNNIKDIAGDLLEAADKYAITSLKNLCEKTIIEDLSVDNVLENILLVTKYKTALLKSKVTKLIVDHLQEIVLKPEYKLLNKECMNLIIRAVAKIESDDED